MEFVESSIILVEASFVYHLALFWLGDRGHGRVEGGA